MKINVNEGATCATSEWLRGSAKIKYLLKKLQSLYYSKKKERKKKKIINKRDRGKEKCIRRDRRKESLFFGSFEKSPKKKVIN